MSHGIYTALSGAIAQQQALDVTANNIANARTTGFQADRVAFQEVLAESRKAAMPNTLSYVAISRVEVTDALGSVHKTGNPLDVALQGEGYFEVQTPNGTRYTRGGSFSTDADGVLRTTEGYAVLGSGGEINIPRETGDLQIAGDGTLSSRGIQLGQLKVVQFADMTQVKKEGLQLVATEGAQPTTATGVQVQQGFLETSNVNAVQGMTQLITATRSFEAFQKVIRTIDEAEKSTARMVRQ